MRINIFDVVELQNNEKATILEVSNNKYLAEIVNQDGSTKEKRDIISNDIKKIIYTRNKER